MKKNSLIAVCITLLSSTTLWATSVEEIYKSKCSNCHGDTANGDTKIISKSPMIKTKGIALTNLSEKELLIKLKNLRKNSEKTHNGVAAMKEYLKYIESGVGKISDNEMASYIYNTFGDGSKK
jgi:cytochrome c553